MRILVIGGTGFIGCPLAQGLRDLGHEVAVFHRGKINADLGPSIRSILGDRTSLVDATKQFRRFAPQVVIDMIAYSEQDGINLMRTFHGVARRVVVLSSMDVYRSYERFRGIASGEGHSFRSAAVDNTPATEDSPLRETLFPYRELAKDMHDLLYNYEKILVERAVMGEPDLPATILRLPAVYGPGDKQHRLFEYLKRMDDGRPAILLDESRAGWRWSRGYVENVAAGIVLAAVDDRTAGRVYNVGEREAHSEAAWVKCIAAATGWTGHVLAVPRENLPHHLNTPYDWRHDCVGDTKRIRDELDYKELVSFEGGLRRTIAWERAHPPTEVDAKQFDYQVEDAAIHKL